MVTTQDRERRRIPVLPTDGNLVRFAIDEIERVGLHLPDSDYDGMLAGEVLGMLRRFEEAGHSGASAHLTLDLFGRLARWKPLGPLTNDPAEWNDVSPFGGRQDPPVWQSRRRPDAFSNDAGKTYYLLDDPRPWWRRLLRSRRIYRSVAREAVAA